MIRSHVQFGAQGAVFALDIMPGCHAISVKVLGGLQQVFEFYPFIAANAGYRGSARKIAFGKIINYSFTEFSFIIKYIVRKIQVLRHASRVMNITPCATGSFFGQCSTMVIELQCDAHNIIALLRQIGCHNRAVDATRHGHNNASVFGSLGKSERV